MQNLIRLKTRAFCKKNLAIHQAVWPVREEMTKMTYTIIAKSAYIAFKMWKKYYN